MGLKRIAEGASSLGSSGREARLPSRRLLAARSVLGGRAEEHRVVHRGYHGAFASTRLAMKLLAKVDCD